MSLLAKVLQDQYLAALYGSKPNEALAASLAPLLCVIYAD